MSKKDYLMIGKVKPNTFIGGVGGTITTKELLAAKLSITADQIQSFEIDSQNNVSCYIGVNYSTEIAAFRYSSILWYIDANNYLTDIGSHSFRDCNYLEEIVLNAVTVLQGYSHSACHSLRFVKYPTLTILTGPSVFSRVYSSKYVECVNLQNITDDCFYMLSADPNSLLEYIYTPKCTQLGSSVSVNNRCFQNIPTSCIVYLDPSLWTVNAGNPDSDLQYLIDRGNDVRAVLNFDIPTIPINITKVNDYGVVVDISWVQPIGSTNAIDYYQIYVNGEYKGRTVGNETNYRIENLNQYSFYTIQVVACDYFYNQSYSELLNIETEENTAFSQITDLAVDTLYSDAAMVDFTTPTGIYTVDYYEVYLDNVFYKNQTTHPIVIGDLTNGQSYSIKVITVDDNGNKSIDSNIINVLINGVNPYLPYNDVISEYKFENNVFDTVGSNNGTPSNITYETGVVGQSAVFNGSSSDVVLPSNIFNNLTEFSVSFLSRSNNSTAEQRFIVLNNNLDSPSVLVRYNVVGNNSMSIGVRTVSGLQQSEINILDVNNYSHIIISVVKNLEFRVYLDGVLIDTVPLSGEWAMNTPQINVFGASRNLGIRLDGNLDATNIWNTDLTPSQALELATLELAGIDITP